MNENNISEKNHSLIEEDAIKAYSIEDIPSYRILMTLHNIDEQQRKEEYKAAVKLCKFYAALFLFFFAIFCVSFFLNEKNVFCGFISFYKEKK